MKVLVENFISVKKQNEFEILFDFKIKKKNWNQQIGLNLYEILLHKIF